MTPNDAYQKLKQWQKALSLTDGDTEMMNADPRLTQLGQPQPRVEDLNLYEQMLREAMERQIPLKESDRKELEYLKQVLQLPDDSVQIIEQQLTRELMLNSPPSPGFFQSAQDLAATTLSPPANGDSYPSAWDPSTMGSPPMDTLQQPVTLQQPDTLPAADVAIEPSLAGSSSSSPNLAATMPPAEMAPAIAATATEPAAAAGADVKGKIGAALKQKRELAMGGTSTAAPESPPGNAAEQPPQVGAAIASSEAIPMSAAVPASGPAVAAASVTTGQAPAGNMQPAPAGPPVEVIVQPAKQRFSRPAIAIGLLLASLITAFSVILWMLNSNQPKPTPNPQAVQNYVKQGNEQTQQQQYQAAINSFNQALKIDAQNPTALLNRGFAQYRSGNLSAALDDYSKAISIQSNFPEAFNNRSHVYNNQGNYDAAMKDATQAIRLKPNFPEAYINLGNAWSGQRNLDQAIKSYDQAIAQKPTALVLSRAYNNRGNARLARQNPLEAIKDFDQAVQNDRQYADAFFNRAIALNSTGNRAGALQGFTDAANLYDAQKNSDMARKARSQAEQLRLATTPNPGSTTPTPQPSPPEGATTNQRSI